MNALEFEAAIRKAITGGTVFVNNIDNLAPVILINFYNLENCSGDGATSENNRFLFSIRGFRNSDHNPVKVKTEQLINSAYTRKRLRAKTTSPEKMVEYIASYCNTIIAEVPQKL